MNRRTRFGLYGVALGVALGGLLLVVDQAGAQSPEPDYAECAPGLVLSALGRCVIGGGEIEGASVSLALAAGSSGNSLVFVGHPTLTTAELCAVVVRTRAPSAGSWLRNCGAESTSGIGPGPGVLVGGTGTFLVSLSGLPAGSWVEVAVGAGASDREVVAVETTPLPTTTTTTVVTTTTDAPVTTTTVDVPPTTVPVEPGEVEAWQETGWAELVPIGFVALSLLVFSAGYRVGVS